MPKQLIWRARTEYQQAASKTRARIPTGGRGDVALGFAHPEHESHRPLATPRCGGQKIREGDKLLLLYHSANRDERVFDDPMRFDVTRTPNEHLAFGGFGTHFCLGASLARLELRVMFEELLRRLPDMELATEEPLPMRPNNFIVGIEEMPVRFAPARGAE